MHTNKTRIIERKKERKKEKELWFGTFLFELLRVLLFVIYEIVRSLFCLLPSFTQHTHIHTTNTQTTRPVAIDRERRRSNIKSSTIIKHQTTTKPWVNKATRVSNAISVGPYYWRIKKGTLALTLVETNPDTDGSMNNQSWKPSNHTDKRMDLEPSRGTML